MIKIIKTNKRCYLNKKDFIDIEDILRDLKADYESFNLPETFEELKKLCRGFEGVKFFYDTVAGVEYININDTIAFNENGLMLAMKNNFDVLVKKRTPAQMYQIIKNLTEGL